MTDKKAQLSVDGKTIDLPIYSGSFGPDVIEVLGLVPEGVCSYDTVLANITACESPITYIDGGKGVLLHRGYPIEQLAENSDYLELCHLLLHGELPTKEENEHFRATVRNHTMVHDQVNQFFKGFRRDAHPMAIMCGVVGALSAFCLLSFDGTVCLLSPFSRLRLSDCLLRLL